MFSRGFGNRQQEPEDRYNGTNIQFDDEFEGLLSNSKHTVQTTLYLEFIIQGRRDPLAFRFTDNHLELTSFLNKIQDDLQNSPNDFLVLELDEKKYLIQRKNINIMYASFEGFS